MPDRLLLAADCAALVDGRLADAGVRTAVVFRQCSAVHRIQGDPAAFWTGAARQVLARRQPLAGYTTSNTLFVLALMMQDYGYRLIAHFDAPVSLEGGAIRRTLFGGQWAARRATAASSQVPSLPGRHGRTQTVCWLLAPVGRGPLAARAAVNA